MYKFHLGFHKTATTHFQDTLCAMEDSLRSRGISYIPRERARESVERVTASRIKRLQYRLYSRLFGPQFVHKQLFSNIAKTQDYLLSEENIMGTIVDALCINPYPNLVKRLDFIKQIAKVQPVECFLSIRAFDAFYTGAYVTGLRFQPMETLQAKNRLMPEIESGTLPSWRPVVNNIIRALPNVRITLWTYEQYQQGAEQVIRRVTEINDIQVPKLSPSVNTATPSINAVRQAETLLNKAYVAKIWRKQCDSIFKHSRNETPFEKFQLFDAATNKALQEQFEQDVEKLTKQHNLTVLAL